MRNSGVVHIIMSNSPKCKIVAYAFNNAQPVPVKWRKYFAPQYFFLLLQTDNTFQTDDRRKCPW